jgi:hypothetical protein
MTIFIKPWILSIDKLSVVYSDPVPDRVWDVCARIVDSVRRGQFPGGILTGHRRFQVQIIIPMPGSSQRFLIQAGRRGKNQRDYRLEFNPALVGSIAVAYILDVLNGIFGEGGERLVRDGVITRIDLALDLPGLSADQVIARSRKQQVHGIFSDRQGTPTNIYLGRRKNNNTTVYTKYDVDGRAHLRTERRMIPRLRGSELVFLKNRFVSVQLVHTDALRPHIDGMIPEQFFDSVRVRGFTHVMQGLDSRQRRALDIVMKNSDHSLLPSMDEVWRTWRQSLIDAGLGFLLDGCTTLADRAMTIRLSRKRRDEVVERLRLDQTQDLVGVAGLAAQWAMENLQHLRLADPYVPEVLNDRAADNWRPRLAIAELAGGEWIERAQIAAIELSHTTENNDETDEILLLTDIKMVFLESGRDRLKSTEITAALAQMEHRRWPEWRNGKPITPVQLARMLARFNIHPTTHRFGDRTDKGYLLDQFVESFARYT